MLSDEYPENEIDNTTTESVSELPTNNSENEEVVSNVPPTSSPTTPTNPVQESIESPESTTQTLDSAGQPEISVSEADERKIDDSGERERKRQWRKNKRDFYKGKKRANGSTLTLIDLIRHFVACGRCGYFLSGYRVVNGESSLQDTLSEYDDSWLPLVWNWQTRDLIYRSFGVRTDISFTYLDFCCDECQRNFICEVFEAESPEDAEVVEFRVELKIRRR